MKLNDLPTFYKQLDSHFCLKNTNLKNATYTNVDSNFVKSSNYPKHRWFNYKEGFSPILVENIIDEFNLKPEAIIVDPFCGAGTTLTVAKRLNINSIGFEVNTFAYFISKVKTYTYIQNDINLYKEYISNINSINFNNMLDIFPNDYVSRMFEKEMFSAQLNIRQYILNLPQSKAKDLLLFTWLCTLEKCSLYRKAGNGLKKKSKSPEYDRKKPQKKIIEMINELSEVIIEDCLNDKKSNSFVKIYDNSAFDMNKKIQNNIIDLVLFSPPYANCFDYTKIYYMELWMGAFIDSIEGQKNIRMESIRSHCHATWPSRYESFHLDELNNQLLPLLKEQKLWTNRIPEMLNGYFADMEEILKQTYQVLKEKGKCAIVVSNSAYAGVIIPTDVFLALIAEKIGFKVIEIEIKRLIITSSQQYKKTENLKQYLRESIVKLEK